MKILITGAGMIGRAVADELAERHDVTVFDVVAPADDVAWDVITGDLREPEVIEAACKGADVVIHTAALHGIHVKSHREVDFMDVNVTGTFNVLAAARDAGIQRVVIASSAAVFSGHGPVLTDELPPQGGDVYGLSKVLNESVAEHFRRKHDMEVVALRYGAIWQLLLQFDRPDVQDALGGARPDLVALAMGGGVTDLRDAVAANVAAALHEGPLGGSWSVLPTTMFAEASTNARASVAALFPDLVDSLPDTLAASRVFDAAPTEQALGIRIAYDQEYFLREAVQLL
ncbi:MAG: nucleoside-diphosphate-sugar epimerase [Glaciecola sp.]|jgi:nucleoside-diphosphate-sugar epimerase